LTGGGGHDILVGGAGNDSLTGGGLASVLIGGTGADAVTGGAAGDLLIGGSTSFDANVAALQAILAEWERTDATYTERIDHLRGAAAGGLNGTFFLKSTTVHDDATADALQGGPGMDWFWAQLAEVLDLQAGELRN
jgi:Ca2+-binding RTX toxin-like protein